MADPVAEPEILKLCFRRAGQVYWGECKNVAEEYIRDGHGIQIFGAQSVHKEPVVVGKYDGRWTDGQMSGGAGRMEFYDTSVYHGDFQDGMLHGVGKLTWPDGTSYDGVWCRNQMHGLGRFISRNGDFWEGHFHRNCFLQHSGKWINLAREQARSEQMALMEGDVAQSPVQIVTTPDELHRAMREAADDNLVPFLIADAAFSENLSPLDWLRQDPRMSTPEEVDDSAIYIKYVAQMRRRKQDSVGHMFNCIQKAVSNGCALPLVFDRPEEDDLPEAWRLHHFFDPFAAPREMFNPRLFHGRGFVELFVPKERQGESVFTKESFAVAPPVEGGIAADLSRTDEDAPDAQGCAEQAPTAFMLHLRVVALSRIPSEVVDNFDLVRRDMQARFGDHVPLHRCSILVLTDAHT